VRENLTLLHGVRKDYSTWNPKVLTSLLYVVVSALSAPAVELFRYRYHAEDGREFEYVFENDEQSAPKTVSDQKAAEIAADWVTSFYHVQVGAIESQEFRTRPIPPRRRQWTFREYFEVRFRAEKYGVPYFWAESQAKQSGPRKEAVGARARNAVEDLNVQVIRREALGVGRLSHRFEGRAKRHTTL